jgi:hypothetical protein
MCCSVPSSSRFQSQQTEETKVLDVLTMFDALAARVSEDVDDIFASDAHRVIRLESWNHYMDLRLNCPCFDSAVVAS